MSVGVRGLHSKVNDSMLILNGTTKTKLAILAFLYCGEIVKNSIRGKCVGSKASN